MRLLLSDNLHKTLIDDDAYLKPFEYTLPNGDKKTIIPAFMTWFLSDGGYAITRVTSEGKRFVIRLHRLLAGNIKGIFVDHINQDKLDNRSINLRLASQSQNSHNRTKCRPPKLSKYKGVYQEGAKYRAKLQHQKTVYNLGLFADEATAARAYDAMLIELDSTTPVYALNNI